MVSPPESQAQTLNTFGVEHLDSLYRYALALTRQRAEAEDLVQETFVRAIGAFDRLRENSNIKGWLFTITRNLWFNELRRRRTKVHQVEPEGDQALIDEMPANTRDALSLAAEKEDAIRVRAAISKLPSEFQEIIILREFEELSYQEIASVLGCPAGTVMSRLGRARSKLRALLIEYEKTPFRERQEA